VRSCAIVVGGPPSALTATKALLEVGGTTILERILAQAQPLFDEILLVGNEPGPYRHLRLPVVPDLYSYGGPLAGLHAALTTCRHSPCFVLAADMPFVTRGLIERVLEAQGGAPGAVPRVGRQHFPLCAVYNKHLAGLAAERLDKRQLDLPGFALAAGAAVVDLAGFAEPPELAMLLSDVDSPEDLLRAENWARTMR
jgi:molybdopterin-guanine dinucleotide biosynthesis protein A